MNIGRPEPRNQNHGAGFCFCKQLVPTIHPNPNLGLPFGFETLPKNYAELRQTAIT